MSYAHPEIENSNFVDELLVENSLELSSFGEKINVIVSKNMERLLSKNGKNNGDFLEFLIESKLIPPQSSPTQIGNYKNRIYTYKRVANNPKERRRIPLGIMAAFCSFINEPMSALFANPDENKEKKTIPETAAFMQAVFGGNKNYAFETQNQNKSFYQLLGKNLEGREYYCYWNPLHSNPGYDKNMKLNKGKLSFYADDDNVCKVKFETYDKSGNSGNTQDEYSGFTILLRPNSKEGVAFCFLRQNGTSDTDILCLSFRLRGGGDIGGDDSIDIRVAEVLTLASYSARPIILRFLLTKQPLKTENESIDKLKSVLSLSSRKITIPKSSFNEITKSIQGDNGLKKRLRDVVKKESTTETDVYIIESTDIENLHSPDMIKLIRNKDMSVFLQ